MAELSLLLIGAGAGEGGCRAGAYVGWAAYEILISWRCQSSHLRDSNVPRRNERPKTVACMS